MATSPLYNRAAIIVGQQFMYRVDSDNLFKLITRFVRAMNPDNKIMYNAAPNNLGYITCCELGLYHKHHDNANTTTVLSYCVGTETVPVTKGHGDYIIYQGYQLPENHENIDIILPTTTQHESVNSYKNVQGRLRTTAVAVATPKKVLPPYQLVNLLHIIKSKMVEGNHTFMQEFENTVALNPHVEYRIMPYNHLNPPLQPINHVGNVIKGNLLGKITTTILNRNINNYYAADLVTRYSKTMSLCASITP